MHLRIRESKHLPRLAAISTFSCPCQQKMGVVHDARTRVESLTEGSGRRACGACLVFFASHWSSHMFFSLALVLCVTHCAALLHRPPGTRTDSLNLSSKRPSLACIYCIIARKDRASGSTIPLGHTTDTVLLQHCKGRGLGVHQEARNVMAYACRAIFVRP